jgi:hypothetical protein
MYKGVVYLPREDEKSWGVWVDWSGELHDHSFPFRELNSL